MNPPLFCCTACQASVQQGTLCNTLELVPCPGCGALLQLHLFPAFFRESAPAESRARSALEGEATCFYHPRKPAALPCEACGRFLCSLCDLELNGRHLCPVCLERGTQKGKLTELERSRVRYDQVAFLLAALPLLVLPLTLFTAPASFYLALRHWNSPTHYVRPSRVWLVLAAALALAQMLGWGVLIFALWRAGT